LTKKYLKKQDLKEFLRVIATDKNKYQLRYFKIQNEEAAEWLLWGTSTSACFTPFRYLLMPLCVRLSIRSIWIECVKYKLPLFCFAHKLMSKRDRAFTKFTHWISLKLAKSKLTGVANIKVCAITVNINPVFCLFHSISFLFHSFFSPTSFLVACL